MGAARHEVPRIGKTRDHPAGRAIPTVGASRTWQQIGVPPATFYRWYDLYQTGGPGWRWRIAVVQSLASVWNRIPDEIRQEIVATGPGRDRAVAAGAGGDSSPTPRCYFVSEASVYRLLKAQDLITSPAFIVSSRPLMSSRDKTTAPKPAVADRLHLSESHRLGLVLSLNHPG